MVEFSSEVSNLKICKPSLNFKICLSLLYDVSPLERLWKTPKYPLNQFCFSSFQKSAEQCASWFCSGYRKALDFCSLRANNAWFSRSVLSAALRAPQILHHPPMTLHQNTHDGESGDCWTVKIGNQSAIILEDFTLSIKHIQTIALFFIQIRKLTNENG